MTDINNAGTLREVLYSQLGQVKLGGVVRELLITAPTVPIFSGIVREVLFSAPLPVLGRQTAVTINTG
jgi:hypothetical protein